MRELKPAEVTYRGSMTVPERWGTWVPRDGDVLVCTPPKCGTTWTQTMVAMLLSGSGTLPGKLGDLSPWVDSALGEAEEMAAHLAAQTGRRVVKTHTPADGFPVWQGVTVIAVYRHPLDVFFSLRKHIANMVGREDSLMLRPVPEALGGFIDGPEDVEDFDRDCLAHIVRHYRETVLSGRIPGLTTFHYADMREGGADTVRRVAEAIGVAADDALIAEVTQASGFEAMRKRPEQFTPVGGTGIWHDDAAFFDSATSGKWEGQLTDEDLARYDARMAALLPEGAARRWLEEGGG